MKLKGKVIALTGAGSGIGRSLALELIARGAHVAALDMNQSSLQETMKLAGDPKRISSHILNVANKGAMPGIVQEILEHHGRIDGLINNAGIIQPFVRIADLSSEAIERVMQVNFDGTLNLIREVLPILKNRPEAHIVNVSSMGGFLPVPGQAVYGASKAAVKLLTEALYAELLETNVHVTIVFPGAIATNISANSGVSVPQPSPDSKSKSAFKALPSEKAAALILNGMERDAFRVLVGSDARMMDLLYRIAPGFATRFIAKQMQNLLN